MEWMRFKQNTDRETDQLKIQSISFIIISPRLVGYLSEMYDLKKKSKIASIYTIEVTLFIGRRGAKRKRL